LQIALVC